MGDGLVFDLDLESIRWSAKCIHDHFGTEKNPDVSVFEMAVQLLEGERSLLDLPALLVIQRDTQIYAVDNRLLYVLRMYRDIKTYQTGVIQKSFNSAPEKMMVTCQLCSSHECPQFTTQNGGVSVEVERPTSIQYGETWLGSSNQS